MTETDALVVRLGVHIFNLEMANQRAQQAMQEKDKRIAELEKRLAVTEVGQEQPDPK